MANIPTIALSAVPQSPEVAPRASAEAFVAPYRAIAQSGGAALGDVAGTLSAFQQKKQEQVDRGQLAAEDTIRKETAAQIDAYMEQNRSNPEQWEKFRENTWQAYERARDQRAKDQKWSRRVQAVDQISARDYIAEANIVFGKKLAQVEIQQSNDRLETNAISRLDAGDVAGAMQSLDGMNLYPHQKTEVVERVTNGHMYGKYARMLSDVGQDTPVQQAERLKVIEQELTATKKNGEPEFGFIEGEDGKRLGGLTPSSRLNLIRETRAKQREAEVLMARTGQGIIKKARLGHDPEKAFQDAFNAGQISQEVAAVYVPEVREAMAEFQREQEAKAEKAAAAKATRQDRAAQTLTAQIDSKAGTEITQQEIERRMAIGITRPNDPQGISPSDAQAASVRLESTEAAAMQSRTFTKIDTQLNEMLGQSWFLWARDKAQMSDPEKTKMLKSIADAKLPVGVKTRLMDKFFEVQLADLRESEVSDKDGDRDIGPEEKELRTNLIELYKQGVATLGASAMGGRYMEDMNQVGDWFAQNPKATPQQKQAKAQEMYQKTQKRLFDDEASAKIRSLPIFQ